MGTQLLCPSSPAIIFNGIWSLLTSSTRSPSVSAHSPEARAFSITHASNEYWNAMREMNGRARGQVIRAFQEMSSRAKVIKCIGKSQNARAYRALYASVAQSNQRQRRTSATIFIGIFFRWCKVKLPRREAFVTLHWCGVPSRTLWHCSIEIYHLIAGNCCCCCCKCC